MEDPQSPTPTLAFQAGHHYRVRLGPPWFVALKLYDEAGMLPLSEASVSLQGQNGGQHTGQTDAEGVLLIPGVTWDQYLLKVEGSNTPALPIPLSHQAEPPVRCRVPGVKRFGLHVRLIADLAGQRPIANAPCVVEGESGLRLEQTTDGDGNLHIDDVFPQRVWVEVQGRRVAVSVTPADQSTTVWVPPVPGQATSNRTSATSQTGGPS